MGLFDLFSKKPKHSNSAKAAKDRLSLILTQEHSSAHKPDYLPQLQRELIEVISKYVKIDADDIVVFEHDENNVTKLEVKFEIPQASQHDA